MSYWSDHTAQEIVEFMAANPEATLGDIKLAVGLPLRPGDKLLWPWQLPLEAFMDALDVPRDLREAVRKK